MLYNDSHIWAMITNELGDSSTISVFFFGMYKASLQKYEMIILDMLV